VANEYDLKKEGTEGLGLSDVYQSDVLSGQGVTGGKFGVYGRYGTTPAYVGQPALDVPEDQPGKYLKLQQERQKRAEENLKTIQEFADGNSPGMIAFKKAMDRVEGKISRSSWKDWSGINSGLKEISKMMMYYDKDKAKKLYDFAATEEWRTPEQIREIEKADPGHAQQIKKTQSFIISNLGGNMKDMFMAGAQLVEMVGKTSVRVGQAIGDAQYGGEYGFLPAVLHAVEPIIGMAGGYAEGMGEFAAGPAAYVERDPLMAGMAVLDYKRMAKGGLEGVKKLKETGSPVKAAGAYKEALESTTDVAGPVESLVKSAEDVTRPGKPEGLGGAALRRVSAEVVSPFAGTQRGVKEAAQRAARGERGEFGRAKDIVEPYVELPPREREIFAGAMAEGEKLVPAQYRLMQEAREMSKVISAKEAKAAKIREEGISAAREKYRSRSDHIDGEIAAIERERAGVKWELEEPMKAGGMAPLGAIDDIVRLNILDEALGMKVEKWKRRRNSEISKFKKDLKKVQSVEDRTARMLRRTFEGAVKKGDAVMIDRLRRMLLSDMSILDVVPMPKTRRGKEGFPTQVRAVEKKPTKKKPTKKKPKFDKTLATELADQQSPMISFTHKGKPMEDMSFWLKGALDPKRLIDEFKVNDIGFENRVSITDNPVLHEYFNKVGQTMLQTRKLLAQQGLDMARIPMNSKLEPGMAELTWLANLRSHMALRLAPGSPKLKTTVDDLMEKLSDDPSAFGMDNQMRSPAGIFKRAVAKRVLSKEQLKELGAFVGDEQWVGMLQAMYETVNAKWKYGHFAEYRRSYEGTQFLRWKDPRKPGAFDDLKGTALEEAKNIAYSKVDDSKVADSDFIQRFGAVSGSWVPENVLRLWESMYTNEMGWKGASRKITGDWKMFHTIGGPHYYVNLMYGINEMVFAATGPRGMTSLANGVESLISKDEWYVLGRDLGTFQRGIAEAGELRMSPAEFASIRNNMRRTKNIWKAHYGIVKDAMKESGFKGAWSPGISIIADGISGTYKGAKQTLLLNGKLRKTAMFMEHSARLGILRDFIERHARARSMKEGIPYNRALKEAMKDTKLLEEAHMWQERLMTDHFFLPHLARSPVVGAFAPFIGYAIRANSIMLDLQLKRPGMSITLQKLDQVNQEYRDALEQAYKDQQPSGEQDTSFMLPEEVSNYLDKTFQSTNPGPLAGGIKWATRGTKTLPMEAFGIAPVEGESAHFGYFGGWRLTGPAEMVGNLITGESRYGEEIFAHDPDGLIMAKNTAKNLAIHVGLGFPSSWIWQLMERMPEAELYGVSSTGHELEPWMIMARIFGARLFRANGEVDKAVERRYSTFLKKLKISADRNNEDYDRVWKKRRELVEKFEGIPGTDSNRRAKVAGKIQELSQKLKDMEKTEEEAQSRLFEVMYEGETRVSGSDVLDERVKRRERLKEYMKEPEKGEPQKVDMRFLEDWEMER